MGDITKDIYVNLKAKQEGMEKLVESIAILSKKTQDLLSVSLRLKMPLAEVKSEMRKLGVEYIKDGTYLDTYKNKMLNQSMVENKVARSRKEAARERKTQLMEERRLQNITAKDHYRNALETRRSQRKEMEDTMLQSRVNRFHSLRSTAQQQELQRMAVKTKVSTDNLTGAMSKSNIGLRGNKEWFSKVTGETITQDAAFRKIIKTTDTFNMNYLGIMFAGMAVQKAFDGVQQSARQATGVTEDWSYVMADLFSPNAERASTAVEWFGERVDNMHPIVKEGINIFVTMGSVMGRVAFTVGQTMLGFHSLRQELPHINAFLKEHLGRTKKVSKTLSTDLNPSLDANSKSTKQNNVTANAAAVDLDKKSTPARSRNNRAVRKGAVSMRSLAKGTMLATGAMLLLGAASDSEFLTELSDKTKDFVDNFTGYFEEGSPLRTVMIAFGIAVSAILVGVLLGISILTAPIVLVIAAILGIVTVVGMLAKHFGISFDGIKDKVSMVMSNAKEKVSIFIDNAKTKFSELKERISTIITSIKDKISDRINRIKDIFNNLKDGISNVFESIKTSISDKIDTIKTKIEEIKTKFKDTFDTIKDSISWSKLVDVGSTIMSKIAEGMAAAKDIVTKAIYAIPVVGPVVERLVESGFFGEIPEFANGGIVTRPTLALIGERGPEAVVPLTGGGVGVSNITYSPTITIEANISNDVDIDYLTRRINENLYNETRRQGIR